MRKGQITKEHIIRQSAGLFNTKGYMGASLSEIMDRCGIRKGGIYNHFENKDEIALAAFEYNFSQILLLLSKAQEDAANSKQKLIAICNVYMELIDDNVLEGGCPLLNTAVESDDGHPQLKVKAQHAMILLIEKLTKIIVEGIQNKEFRSDIDHEEVCSYIIAMIEGGIMLSKLFDDNKYIRHCSSHVMKYIDHEMMHV